MPTSKPLLISLKDTVAKNHNDHLISDAFRQIEVWSQNVAGVPPPTTSTTVVRYNDPSGQLWVAKAGVNGGQYRLARDVLHGKISRLGAWNVSVTQVQFSYDNVYRDPYGMFGGGGWIIPAPGVYLWTSSVACGTLPSGQFFAIDNQVNGSSIATVVQGASASGPGGINLVATSTTSFLFAAGDNLHLTQRGGTAVAGTVGSNWSYSTLDYLGTG